jgi:CDP-diacylglycerol--glycerol-3-phosphate 3-phosphatidyltransferase
MKAALREQLLTAPNLLTLLRVGSIPVLLVLMTLEGKGWAWLAAWVFCVSGLTDLLDGWLARRMKKVSVMGQYLDPVADKLLIASMLVMLVALGRVPAWITIVIICRELAVTGLRAVAASQGFTLPSDMAGKSKTAVQMLAVFLLIGHYSVGGFDPHYWGMICLWAALVFTVWSGLGYFLRFRRKLLSSEKED